MTVVFVVLRESCQTQTAVECATLPCNSHRLLRVTFFQLSSPLCVSFPWSSLTQQLSPPLIWMLETSWGGISWEPRLISVPSQALVLWTQCFLFNFFQCICFDPFITQHCSLSQYVSGGKQDQPSMHRDNEAENCRAGRSSVLSLWWLTSEKLRVPFGNSDLKEEMARLELCLVSWTGCIRNIFIFPVSQGTRCGKCHIPASSNAWSVPHLCR